MDFLNKWLELVDKKNSVLCAGVDPADYEMGRGEKGLPKGMNKRDWTLKYIESVACSCSAIKPNKKYFDGNRDSELLQEMYSLAKSRDLVVIDDSKIADIGSTNDAGFYHSALRADAVTLAPFAGNLQEASVQAKSRNIGLISMCLMSNKEYEREKNNLVPLTEDEAFEFREEDLFRTKDKDSTPYVKQYIYLADQAKKSNLDGIVIGAPSEENHISEYELGAIKEYSFNPINKMLVLLPGVGAQGGEAGKIWEYFDSNRVIVNVGRSLMFPNGSNSTSDDHKAAALHYQNLLNELRLIKQ